MFTTCPQCARNLAVTASDLRLGQGYVRCGRCSGVFNALASLADEPTAPASTPDEPPEPALPLEVPPLASALEGIEVTDGEPPIDPNEVTGENEVLRTGVFETIVLEGDGITQTEEAVEESEVDAQLQALVQRFDAVREAEAAEAADLQSPPIELDDEALPAESLDLAEEPSLNLDLDEPDDETPFLIETPLPATDEATAAAVLPVTLDTPDTPDALTAGPLPEEAVSPTRRGLWITGSVLLALLLAGQAVHQFREALVAQAWAAQPLTALYRAFGVTLEPHWDLQAYDVRQLGADAVPGESPHIAVRASIHNRAKRSQPLPLLRVMLQDRFGNQIATREVAPLEYLRGTPAQPLPADQRVDADLLLPDPGQTAVGFEIDACLRNAGGVLRCAGDPAPR